MAISTSEGKLVQVDVLKRRKMSEAAIAPLTKMKSRLMMDGGTSLAAKKGIEKTLNEREKNIRRL